MMPVAAAKTMKRAHHHRPHARLMFDVMICSHTRTAAQFKHLPAPASTADLVLHYQMDVAGVTPVWLTLDPLGNLAEPCCCHGFSPLVELPAEEGELCKALAEAGGQVTFRVRGAHIEF